MKTTTLVIATLLLLLLGLPSQPFLAQEGEISQAGEDIELYIETIDVDIINVDTYVVDKKGNPVLGLTVDDFELFEDGRPVKIQNFYTVEGGRGKLPGEDAPAATTKDPTSIEDLPRVRLQQMELPEDQRLRVIIFFDNLFLRPFNRNKVIRQVRTFLHGTLGPDDQVMLVSFERTLNVRHPFTTNRQAIADELFQLEDLSAFGVQGDAERKGVIRRIQMADNALEAEGFVDFYAKNQFANLTNSIRALQELVGSLAGLPGRKVLLHVSDGLPMNAGQDLFQLLATTFQEKLAGVFMASNRYSARRQFSRLAASANTNRVTFYTLEAAGLRSHESLSAANGGTGGNLQGGSMIDVDFSRVMNTTEPLQLMAYETGGQATFGSNNIAGALARMSSDLKNYYSLGYSPATSGDGRYHKIVVKVRKKGYKVRHRRGYRGRTAEAQVNDSTIASLLYGIEKNPLGVELEFSAPILQDTGNYLLPLKVRVPIGNLTLLPLESNHQGKIRVSVAVIDAEGSLSPVEQTQIPITIPNKDLDVARTKFFAYEVQLLMRKGNQRIAIGVRDDFAGEISFLRHPVRI